MNPHQKNKFDISSLSPDEQRLFRMYGKLPNKTDLLQNKLKERKYFDSGDYALSKAGRASDVGVTSIGREHPNPENIPHATSSLHTAVSSGADSRSNSISGSNGRSGSVVAGLAGGSPVKESSFLNREQSIDDQPGEEEEKVERSGVGEGVGLEGMPIRGQR